MTCVASHRWPKLLDQALQRRLCYGTASSVACAARAPAVPELNSECQLLSSLLIQVTHASMRICQADLLADIQKG